MKYGLKVICKRVLLLCLERKDNKFLNMATNISTIKVKATAEKLWAMLTKPELVKQWQYGSDLVTDWQVGSSIRFRTEWKDKVFEQWGKVLEVVPQKLIRYSLFAPRPISKINPRIIL
jgi:uncharacterized protein YndB with AHSA1/START domain